MEKFYQYLILKRIKDILQDKKLATYKLEKSDLIKRLNNYFWDKENGTKGFWNKKIYKRFVYFINKTKEKHKDRADINYRTTYSDNLDVRTDELISRLIDQKILVSDNKTQPSYYIYEIPIFNIIAIFWEVIIVGIFVSVLVNLISYFLWEMLK